MTAGLTNGRLEVATVAACRDAVNHPSTLIINSKIGIGEISINRGASR
jgi:hypothetical protein